ncbi:aspartate carbamoyltransferase catalytic subunit [Thermoflavimicrobium dichotomicum]|uniref:Aspartate carbamoyltransferase n=1 Tax=Thermoflavimicrobium dichotomicum TaxID=46223 RepID=A0A1I3SXD1_9BACL|nr:aspartate carbamoyltransferase catalytic subunit [Thermoflavimicrobium dichotomicum]SFJ62872.1 aspartate carbamoyltransferase catalytic subunit [Thermoflavimicrobium dichotomicum]
MLKPAHLIDTKDLTKQEVEEILERAWFWEKNREKQLMPFAGRFAANLFFEPSTRTRFSFEVAEKKLGFHVLNFSENHSSAVKGESLYDTVKTLVSLGVEVITIRHRDPEAILELVERNPGCSIVNAGAGALAHPTQSLLDLYTIKKHFGELAGLQVAIVGDLAHSRVVRSNLWSMQKFGIQVILSGPPEMRDPELERLAPYVPFEEAIETADVVMMLRVQLERHESKLFTSAEQYNQAYGLTLERAKRMKPGAIIMHPGPFNRGVEIVDELVEDSRSKIFEQKANGVFVRMAVLEKVLQGGTERENIVEKWASIG